MQDNTQAVVDQLHDAIRKAGGSPAKAQASRDKATALFGKANETDAKANNASGYETQDAHRSAARGFRSAGDLHWQAGKAHMAGDSTTAQIKGLQADKAETDASDTAAKADAMKAGEKPRF